MLSDVKAPSSSRARRQLPAGCASHPRDPGERHGAPTLSATVSVFTSCLKGQAIGPKYVAGINVSISPTSPARGGMLE